VFLFGLGGRGRTQVEEQCKFTTGVTNINLGKLTGLYY
jgi:hypothetical protein